MTETTRTFKFIVIGSSGVGKTAILKRLIDDVFTGESQSTIGVEFLATTLDVEGQSVKLQIWDTAGQELFRSVTRGYYRGSVGALLLFDISTPDSFNTISEWVNDIREIARPECVIALIGNKLDLCPPNRRHGGNGEADPNSQTDSNDDQNSNIRFVPEEDARNYAQNNSMLYYEVSAKTGQNVQTAFDGLVDAIEKNIEEARGYFARSACWQSPF